MSWGYKGVVPPFICPLLIALLAITWSLTCTGRFSNQGRPARVWLPKFFVFSRHGRAGLHWDCPLTSCIFVPYSSSEALLVPNGDDRGFAQPTCSVYLRYMPGAQTFVKGAHAGQFSDTLGWSLHIYCVCYPPPAFPIPLRNI
jgi:hypothetical protein